MQPTDWYGSIVANDSAGVTEDPGTQEGIPHDFQHMGGYNNRFDMLRAHVQVIVVTLGENGVQNLEPKEPRICDKKLDQYLILEAL